MALRINTNVDAANSSRRLDISRSQLSTSLQRLASGRRINSGADDAAGLAISEAIGAQVRGANAAVRNVQDGISLVQTADGALAQTSDNLQRIRELTVQASNGTLSTEQRGAIQAEITALQGNVDDIAATTQFNGRQLLDGSQTNVQLQSGPNVGANNTTSVSLPNASAAAIGAGPAQVDVSTPAAANVSLANIDQAIASVSAARGDLGATQNALENTAASLNVASENQASAVSRIRDLDFARGVSDQVRNSILSDAGAAVLAQANFSTRSVLRLLG